MTELKFLLPTEHVVLLAKATGENLSDGITLEVAEDRRDETRAALVKLGLQVV